MVILGIIHAEDGFFVRVVELAPFTQRVHAVFKYVRTHVFMVVCRTTVNFLDPWASRPSMFTSSVNDAVPHPFIFTNYCHSIAKPNKQESKKITPHFVVDIVMVDKTHPTIKKSIFVLGRVSLIQVMTPF